jgi:septum formation topological specificity factor MinE
MQPTLTSDRCFGAASAKKRLDVVIRDAINAGDIPGPRYLANGQEMARRGGELVGGITAFADGPDEMRKVIREHVEIGVDNIKLSMSGEEVSRRLLGFTTFSNTVHANAMHPDHRDPIGPRLLLHRRRDCSMRR